MVGEGVGVGVGFTDSSEVGLRGRSVCALLKAILVRMVDGRRVGLVNDCRTVVGGAVGQVVGRVVGEVNMVTALLAPDEVRRAAQLLWWLNTPSGDNGLQLRLFLFILFIRVEVVRVGIVVGIEQGTALSFSAGCAEVEVVVVGRVAREVNTGMMITAMVAPDEVRCVEQLLSWLKKFLVILVVLSINAHSAIAHHTRCVHDCLRVIIVVSMQTLLGRLSTDISQWAEYVQQTRELCIVSGLLSLLGSWVRLAGSRIRIDSASNVQRYACPINTRAVVALLVAVGAFAVALSHVPSGAAPA